MIVRTSAPAKINLALGVGGPRPDGYHELATVFHAVDLRDTVTVESAPAGSGITVTLAGEGIGQVPLDASNLAARAAALVADAVGRPADVHLHIDKCIPVAGGMAGGSADAAATLLACDALWDAGLSRAELTGLAARLGSDVPFALHGGTMLGHGRGEQVAPVLSAGELHWTIVTSEAGLSTPAVYAECDRLRGDAPVPEPVIDEALLSALRSADVLRIAPALRNDLQPAAVSLRPALARILREGVEFGALAGIVSGSGPTCVFLCRDADRAQQLVVDFAGSGLGVQARTARGPAPGARRED